MNAKKEIRKYIAPSIYLLLSSVFALAVIALSFRLSVIYDTEAALEEANPLLLTDRSRENRRVYKRMVAEYRATGLRPMDKASDNGKISD